MEQTQFDKWLTDGASASRFTGFLYFQYSEWLGRHLTSHSGVQLLVTHTSKFSLLAVPEKHLLLQIRPISVNYFPYFQVALLWLTSAV